MKLKTNGAKAVELGYGKTIIFGAWLQDGRPGLAICKAKRRGKPRELIANETEIGPLMVGIAFKDRYAIEHLRDHLEEILENIDAQEEG